MIFTPRLLPAFSHMPKLLMHREGRSLQYLFSRKYLARPLSDEAVDGYLRAQRCPDVSRAIAALYRGMIIPEVMALAGGEYRRMRLRPPTLALFGRQDGQFPEHLVRHICRDYERRADRFALAFVDDASHFLTDDAPDEVVRHSLEWFATVDSDAETASDGA
jgi:pimeloyl-ACP methyl ester carboxylesterase